MERLFSAEKSISAQGLIAFLRLVIMNRYLLVTVVAVLFVSGCASSQPDMYSWGPYEDSLFAVYHEPEFKEEVLNEYMKFIRADDHERRVAPGLYAEAGTFMLNQGMSLVRSSFTGWSMNGGPRASRCLAP